MRTSNVHRTLTGARSSAWRGAVMMLVMGMGVGVLHMPGCVSEQRTASPGEPAATAAVAVPESMDRLVEAMMRYRAGHGRLPGRLSQLVDAELVPAAERQILSDYAYAPGGLGTLDDGRRIVLVDAYIRPSDQAWCIVRPVGDDPGAAQVELALVSLDALGRAAERERAHAARQR